MRCGQTAAHLIIEFRRMNDINAAMSQRNSAEFRIILSVYLTTLASKRIVV
jgi:hypothetical protein